MAIIKVSRKELGSLRFARLQENMGWGRAQTLGCLALFWADTRASSIEEIHPDALVQYVSAPLHETAPFIAALKLAGYLQGGDGFHDTVRIVDNADIAAKRQERVTQGRKSGQASAAAKRAAKAPPKARTKALAKPAAQALAEPAPDTTTTAFQAACRTTWDAYLLAYTQATGQAPVRNAKNNSLIVQLVKRLGHAEAPHVIAFYVTHPNSFYAERCYSLDMAVRDCEGLRTQWARGQPITRERAQAHSQTNEIDRRRAEIGARIAAATASGAQ